MDPRQLFIDERHTGMCVYCGTHPDTRDHFPSKVLLDEPYPPELPVVRACEKCNASFSLDEQYLACFLDCVIRGGAEASHYQRRFRSAGNGLLFDNSLNIEGLRLKGRMENGYEEGCTRGATKEQG